MSGEIGNKMFQIIYRTITELDCISNHNLKKDKDLTDFED